MSKIYLIRHGLTELNEDHRLRGWLDVNLSHEGHLQAEKLSQQLKDIPFSIIYSSDLKRARDTASPLKKTTGADIVNLASLRPLNFGLLNGRKLDEVGPELDNLMDRWKGNPNAKAPMGESFSDFQDRQHSFWEGILKDLKPNENIAVVAHLRNAAYAHAYADNGRKPLEGNKVSEISKEVQKPGSYTILNYDNKSGKLSDGVGPAAKNNYEE